MLRLILENDFCGVLAEGVKTALPNPNTELYEKLIAAGVPLVFVHGGYPSLKNVACIDDDNSAGAYMLTRYLINKGHTHISGIFKSDDIQGHQRYLGFVTALIDAHLPIPDDAIMWFSTEDKYAIIEHGDTTRLKSFIRSNVKGSTAVVAYNDEIAYYLIRELDNAHIGVPEQLAVVSFDNSHYCALSRIPITSLGHDGQTSGAAAAQFLLSAMDGGKAPEAKLTWTLHQRQSS